jgi:predicted DsbA family dithiol-disulfide isomerase
MRVDVWSDVVCPWCHIGKRRFETAVSRLAEHGVDEPIEVRYRAFQLDPGAPSGPGRPVAEVYAAKFGGPEHARRIFDHLEQVASAEGIAFDFTRAVRANTFDAHRLLARAWQVGGSAMQTALKESLMMAYFTEGLDLGDRDVLLARAGSVGLDATEARSWLDSGGGGRDEVRADLEEAARREIHSVPTYVIGDGFPVPGAQEPDVFVRVLTRMAGRR